jgi:ubiquitin-protein ligase
MFCYISELEKINNLKKTEQILKLYLDIKYIYNNDSINIVCKKYNQKYCLYYDKSKPSYLISENETDTDDIMKIYENVNNTIDEYDSLESVILDIINKTDKVEQNKKIIEINEKQIFLSENKKNITEFENELDDKKEKYINENNLINTKLNTGLKLFSLRSNVEMLRDQILKLYLDDKFNIIIDNYPQIQILVSNFTFIGSAGLVITIDMDMSCLNLLSEPPKIKINSSKALKDNILKVINELKPFVDKKSWSIKYSISDTVQNIYNMINTFGEIEQEFSSEFDRIINELEYLVSIKNKSISEVKLLELFDKELIKSNTVNQLNQSKQLNQNQSNKSYWKSGTGYGNNKTKEWDIDKYIKSVNEKKNKISISYSEFIEYLSINYGNGSGTKISLSIDSINRIINLLLNYLQNEEVVKSNVLLIMNFIQNNFTQFKSDKILKFTNLIKMLKEYVEENDIIHKLFDTNSTETIKVIETISNNNNNNGKLDELAKLIGDQSFKMYSENFKGFHYKTQIQIDSTILTRMKKEFNIIKKSISVNQEASIFFWVEKNKLERMRFIITGPVDTPYDQGLYIFDMTLGYNFPSKPPLVHFSNNGGVRFNPNLYNCGKVCLSLLGTWRGDKGESWNPSTSTFFQLLVSIQSQILIEEPFFNEPGYEQQIGKESGKKNSKEYNDNIRQYNVDYAINGLIEGIIEAKSSYPEFETIIRNYFKFKRDRIIGILNKWESEYVDGSKKKKFVESKNKFIELSSKL